MEIRPVVKKKCPKGPAANGKSCVCKCPCGKGGKYRQPPRPKSFAPNRVYTKPSQVIESNTTYRKSYQETFADKAVQIIPPNNLGVIDAPFSRDTIQKMSYPGWTMRPPDPILPCNHALIGKGPMAEITTTRHDYVPKPYEKPEVIIPGNNIFTNTQPLSDKTTNRLSYRPVTTDRPDMIIPINNILPAQGPMSDSTTQKLSFKPVCIPEKDDMPWAKKKQYQPPTMPFSTATIYKKSYIPNPNYQKVEAIYPIDKGNPLTSSKCFESNTIYKKSYVPNPMNERPDMIIPPNNLGLSDQPMADKTINKLSYRPNYGFAPPDPIRACNHKLIGEGPMAEITTTRHDYVPKPFIKSEEIRPTHNIMSSTAPLSDKTINRLSYRVNVGVEVPKPIIPPNALEPPTGKMEENTTQKMSYRPVCAPPKEDYPWARKKVYQPPCQPFAGATIYNLSFECPGDYVGEPENCTCRCSMEGAQPEPCLKPIIC